MPEYGYISPPFVIWRICLNVVKVSGLLHSSGGVYVQSFITL